MITCKEDLINTYIENDHGELRDLYLDKCEKFGFLWQDGTQPTKYESRDLYIMIDRSSIPHKITHTLNEKYICGLKQLTLSDLKPNKQSAAIDTLERMGYEWHGGELWKPPVRIPKVEAEYLKAEFDSAWKAVKAFEDGEELYTHFQVDGWVLTEHAQQVVPNWQVEKIYRRTEKQIDWREESHGYLAAKTGFHWSTPIAEVINDESDCFLELCRTALRARGEL